ncbi:bifunctional proline dehydrogenase/L-glutamate gamma-semialdehyde dehydrogenase PutA [Mangrovimicrobium sediminis]|uniref:bifunctional proline dehydrogenase/L-glutamate gamma-semialdehyde dehydrogenase PutA n=1 Tax=Mangrovimicrobium sediminis TaxID=2562682 RepID=UPI001F112EF8|nr:bifunctional proline dehydrogenase/L-glutamate gamma-semialdehyde dehydrogenase PutA [Haliea sp. SAOS-164]
MAESLDTLRQRIRAATFADEPAIMRELLEATSLDGAQRRAVRAEAIALVERCRGESHRAGTLDAFMQEFGLSNQEGIALMCLAESLLRVPDEETADRLIAEKIHSGDWAAHRGKSSSAFVNASVWGLMLTGRIIPLDSETQANPPSLMRRLVASMGEPVVRRAVLQAMRILGGQYVLGRDIREALRRGRGDEHQGSRYSFDMLGEGARTDADAQRYHAAYAAAIEVIASDAGGGVESANGISVKLSALHPRYAYRQRERVLAELLPRVQSLAQMARAGNIGFSIDAEECDRLDLSLDLFAALARDPALAGWDGLGFVLQAYQKRAVHVARWLAALARESGRRIMVRLVKGAYWDSEIKHAQEQGLVDYPVFTRKCHTDLSYEVCAGELLAAQDCIYPQFATHNAYTVSLVRALTARGGRFEFQRLHGMGHLLYDQLLAAAPDTPVRVYAPVGSHRDLLPYLVRRLLENGANSSFVNRFLDEDVPAETLLGDPREDTCAQPALRHAQIPAPRELYAQAPQPWRNSAGFDLADPQALAPLLQAVDSVRGQRFSAAPLVGGVACPGGPVHDVRNPANTAVVVGSVVEADAAAVENALARASTAQRGWDAGGVALRADCLERAADLLEARGNEFIALLAAEAGRTLDDGLAELREAVDFCRYYAAQGRAQWGVQELPGPTGESNQLSLHGRGVFLCISPWNFPLAIFLGQVAAALVAGNTVLAKPAEQTPLVAARACALLHEAGVPGDVLHLLPGDGPRIGAQVLADPRLSGVAFTGGLDTAAAINRQLAAREGAIVPLIAETGGLNAMLADATALPEQLVDDVINSAFRSAGQRCSALRVLYLQDDIADGVITMLGGAMRELRLGDPASLATDIGPVIDPAARDHLEAYCARMRDAATELAACTLDDSHQRGCFVPPRVFQVRSMAELPGEVFGPVLHLVRYRSDELPKVLEEINASGYGLTLGVHSRIDGFAREVFAATRVGNTYINRNMVGAVVGVNPFGGQGLSGTGPKAGGPHYLARFATEKTRTDNLTARGGNTDLFSLRES